MLNVARGQVIYFDGNRVRMVDVETLDDELLFVMPADREAIGQNCVTPDGQWLIYIDAPKGSSRRKPCQGTKVVAYNLDTKEERVLQEYRRGDSPRDGLRRSAPRLLSSARSYWADVDRPGWR